MFSKARLAAFVGLAALGACNTAYRETGSPDPAFGEALKYDMAMQVVNPDPVYPADGAQPGDSGAKAQGAAERYRRDQALARHNREARQGSAISTTSGGGGG